ncbi:hypothetical protein GCM10022408_02820 [Hymenobacter fastidiosus]|uniref:Type I restriction enzyme R protein N-terminal domain-containing protein n=1 Tax=Hymenobacter fastidiosus TaxID=486264 RepID=A0ABP7RCJ4_9BACT
MSVISPLATLCGVLQTVCRSAAADSALLKKNEAATRAALIDPVLRVFGWDTSNVRMVEPEKTIGGDLRVDYLLFDSSGTPQIVIEAKCLGENLEKHGYVSKVLGYALGFKVQTVFITDGINWHCYTNLNKGAIESFSFCLSETTLLQSAVQFIQLLDAAHCGYSGYLNGYSYKDSIDSTSQILDKVDGAFMKSSNNVKSQIKNIKGSSNETQSPPFIELAKIKGLKLENGQKPTLLKLPDGSVLSIKIWKDILVESCKFILANNLDISLPLSDKAGKTRSLFYLEKPIKVSSIQAKYKGRSIYIATNYSAKDCIDNALYVLAMAPKDLNLEKAAVSF